MHALVAGTHPCPQQSAINAMIVISAAFQSARLLSTTVNTASKVHFNALRSLTQPCLTAYCTQRNIFTIQAFCQALPISVYFCKECLRSDLSRKTAASILQECTRLCQINTAQRARTLLHSMPDHCCTACQITTAQHARSLLHSMPDHYCTGCWQAKCLSTQHAAAACVSMLNYFACIRQ